MDARRCRAVRRPRDGSFATGVIHLWHAEADRSALPENDRKLGLILEGDSVRAKHGLSALRVQPAANNAAGT